MSAFKLKKKKKVNKSIYEKIVCGLVTFLWKAMFYAFKDHMYWTISTSCFFFFLECAM